MMLRYWPTCAKMPLLVAQHLRSSVPSSRPLLPPTRRRTLTACSEPSSVYHSVPSHCCTCLKHLVQKRKGRSAIRFTHETVDSITRCESSSHPAALMALTKDGMGFQSTPRQLQQLGLMWQPYWVQRVSSRIARGY